LLIACGAVLGVGAMALAIARHFAVAVVVLGVLGAGVTGSKPPAFGGSAYEATVWRAVQRAAWNRISKSKGTFGA